MLQGYWVGDISPTHFVIRIFNKETIAYIGRKAYSSTAVSTEYSFLLNATDIACQL